MMQKIVFGLGGYCENCDSSHNHPLHNIIEIVNVEEPPPPVEEPEI